VAQPTEETPTDETPADEAAEHRPRWRTWLPRIFAVVVLLAAGVFALVRLEVIGGPSAAERAATVRAALTQRMTTTLEQMPATGHAGHGATDTKGTTVCGVRVYGYDPKDAKSADDVDTVYGFHMCAVAEQNGTWDFATKFVAPLVMKFDTTPPSMQMVEATETVSYRDRIFQVLPAEYQQAALTTALEPAAMADLRRRFDAAVASA
jgi:hypothetical protein